MNRFIALPLGLLAFALFCFFYISSHAPMLQHDIMTRTAEVLSAKGISTGGLSVSGRDVLLSGSPGSPIVSHQTRDIVGSVSGVRVVSINLIHADVAIPPDSMPDAKTLAVKSEAQQKLNTLLGTGTIEFRGQSTMLTAAGRRTLDQIVPILAATPSLLCDINAYTDSTGDDQGNMDLSDRRATATKSYLVSKGIAAGRLNSKGYGEANPIAANNTWEGRRRNRRIEFVLKEKK